MKDTTLINCLNGILEKDKETYNHSMRLGLMAKLVAKHLKFEEEQMVKLIIGCFLHDLGKIFIPDKILHKVSALNPHEWAIMKRHPVLGAMLLECEGDVEEEVVDIVKYHHERIDGKGYPYGLQGDNIPVYARICSILDAYDSMVSDRAYRKGLTPFQAREELLKQSGTQFDESYVHEFLSISQYLLDVKEELASGGAVK